ncbi:MAG: hypothetical protein Q8M31_09960 [Beijerinckiaceae bacterium]|nr:hypothetical protein [Beijerinckiaceae bacterium]
MSELASEQQSAYVNPKMVSPFSWPNPLVDSRQYLKTQDKILSRADDFATQWLDRRQIGAHAAVEALRSMNRAPSPLQAFVEYQNWARGAAERLAADAAATQSCALRIIGEIVTQLQNTATASDQDKAGSDRRSA